MAKPHSELKRTAHNEPNVRKGADTPGGGQHRAIWCNAARYCWFKVNLFIPVLTQTLHLLLHVCLFHAEGDLGALVAE